MTKLTLAEAITIRDEAKAIHDDAMRRHIKACGSAMSATTAHTHTELAVLSAARAWTPDTAVTTAATNTAAGAFAARAAANAHRDATKAWATIRRAAWVAACETVARLEAGA